MSSPDKKKLLIVTSDYHHPIRHRIHNMLDYYYREFDVDIISQIPKEYGENELDNIENVIKIKLNYYIPFVSFILYTIITRFKINELNRLKKYDACLSIGIYSGLPTVLSNISCPIFYEDTDRFKYFYSSKMMRFIVALIENYCIRKSDYVISVGFSLADSAKEIRKDDHVACIPNGVNNAFFNNRQKIQINDNLLVYLGSVEKWSGIDIAVAAMPLIIKEIPNIKLMIIGDGNYLDEVKKLCIKNDITDHVIFTGKKSYSEVPGLLQKCKIGLAIYPPTELMKYAFTLKIIEYMSSGLIVITTDVGDGATLIKDSWCGKIVDYDHLSLSKEVIDLINNGPLLEMLSSNGRKYSYNYEWSVLATSEIDLIKNRINCKS
jgi:glycosyltransferase involved in cell wall biosynthesis